MTETRQRVTLRLTPQDEAAINQLHTILRRTRRGWISQTDIVRYALKRALEVSEHQA